MFGRLGTLGQLGFASTAALAASLPITAIAADGWQATATEAGDTPGLSAPIPVTRQGFDTSGEATTYSGNVYAPTRVRQVEPNQASWTADSVALTQTICAGDTVAGVTNNSTAVSPTPIATWGMMDREVVGDSLDWEIVPFHWAAREGRQVAGVAVRATDGANITDWQYVSTTSLSSYCEEDQSAEVFSGTLDISGLNDDAGVTLQGKVFPWFGVSASVLDSATESEWRFGPRYFYRSTSRLAAPPVVYVASTGNDTSGVASTNDATAAASPCLTLGGALSKLSSLQGSGGPDVCSGAIIYIVDSVAVGSLPFAYLYQDYAAIKITKAPGSTRAAAVLTVSANYNMYAAGNHASVVLSENALTFEDVSIAISGVRIFSGHAGRSCHYQFRNVNFDFGSVNQSSGLRGGATLSVFGMDGTGYGGLAFGYTTNGDLRMLRGFTCDLGDQVVWGYCVIGCTLDNGAISMNQAERGALIYNNHLPDPHAADAIGIDAATLGNDMGGIAVVQNLVPRLRTNAVPGIGIARDGQKGNCTHLVLHHNTTPGDDDYNRWNILYDNTSGTVRTHVFASIKGNVCPQFNNKGDVELADASHVGNFQIEHGVNCAGNYSEDAPGSASYSQVYPGPGSLIANGDPLYTTDNAVQASGPTAGSAGGDYTLQPGSPARDLFSEYLLQFDITGNARPTSGTVDAGCYA